MKKIKVYYTPGAFGNFLGYLIDSFSEKKLLSSPFLPSGSSHGRADALHKTKVYPINLELEYKHFKLIGYEPHPSIKAKMVA